MAGNIRQQKGLTRIDTYHRIKKKKGKRYCRHMAINKVLFLAFMKR